MARKSSSTIVQDELYPQAGEAGREEQDDARPLNLDIEDESPFLRGQKRVSVRRSALPKKAATGLTWFLVAAAVVFMVGLTAAGIYQYGEHSWRFRVESSDNIEISGLHNVARQQVMEVMGSDIGRNIFFIPLSERQKQLEQIPWVESASVMRFVPNRLRIDLQERTPIAFARVGSKIYLIDAGGTLMDLPAALKKKYSFPVILGMNTNEPLSTREARMKVYDRLIGELDSGGAHYSHDLSEVDLSDTEDVKVTANDPGGQVLVHLGSSDFLDRYKIYVSHVREWRQQFARLDSVDLRYDNQIVVNPDLRGAAPAAVEISPEKPAALITKEAAPAKKSTKESAKKQGKARHHQAASGGTSAATPASSAVSAQGPATGTIGPPAQAVNTAKPIGPQPAPQLTPAQGITGKPSPAIPKAQEQ
jgi:cell division protein FtsQ